MKNEEMQKIVNSIQEKIGNEASGLISDDLGMLITDNTNMNKDLTNKENEINKLKQQKEQLIATNGNLLQQVSMGNQDDFKNNIPTKKDDEPKKPFSFKAQFDEKGNFIE